MAEDGVYREPAAPKLIGRVNPSREFGSSYARAQTLSGIATTRMFVYPLVGALVLGSVFYVTLPEAISHLSGVSHCFCKFMHFTLAVMLPSAIVIGLVVEGIMRVKPDRAKFRECEAQLSEIRRFNNEAAKLNGEISEFARAPAWRRHEIVAEALYLEESRPRILQLAKVRHER